MSDVSDVLRSLPVFADLTDDELGVIAGVASTRTLEAGAIVYHGGEAGGEAFVVIDGGVEHILTAGGMESTVHTSRSGAIFGILSWLDGGTRPITARAAGPTEILAFDAAALDRLREANPDAAAGVLRFLAARLSEATRTIAARFESVLKWNLDVSGAAGLGIDRLITDRIDVTLDLMNGTRLRGTLLKVEQSVAGHEIFLKTSDGAIGIVPYHAIASATFPQGNLLALDDTSEEA